MTRVVITGLGVLSPLALAPEPLYAALCSRKSGVVALPRGLPIPFAAPCAEFTGKFEQFVAPTEDMRRLLRKGIKLMSREIQMAVAVAGYALADGKCDKETYAPQRIGISFGSDYILTTPDEILESVKACCREDGGFDFSQWVECGMPLMTPLWQLKYLPNMPASHIAIYNDLQGPSNSVTLREASVGAVIGESAEIIRAGRADAMLVGTTGSRVLHSKMIQGVQQEEIASDDNCDGNGATACRPFAHNRCGTVLGEGAGALLLESETSAKNRGATIYGEVVAACAIADYRREKNTRSEVILRAMKTVIERAEIDANSLGHINAHGLGEMQADANEAAAIAELVGTRVPVITIKGHCGNLGAGSGTVELIASLMALQHGTLFPTRNHEKTAVDCPINVVNTDNVASGDSFLKIAYNHTGQVSAVLIRRTE